jgi:hypothetical protein
LIAYLSLAGCVTLPEPADLRASVAAYPGGSLPSHRDGRARFREIFCRLAAPSGEQRYDATSCDDLLWVLKDELAPGAQRPVLPELPADLRIFVVSGAFGDCRDLDTIPFGEEVQRLASQGMMIEAVMVSGRSGTEHNSRQIAEAIQSASIEPGTRIVLVGYSKGAIDILQFLTDFPQLGQRVVSVVSIAGPIFGSPLASKANWWYRTLLAESFSERCDPGDGLVISSLLPDTRRQWLEDHRLPGRIAYFSLAGFTTEEHMSLGLKPPWRLLAKHDPRNDGQVLIEDAVIPGAILLGYANADHWDIAIAVERQMPHLSRRKSSRQYPRAALLDATLRYVSESLESAGHPGP